MRYGVNRQPLFQATPRNNTSGHRCRYSLDESSITKSLERPGGFRRGHPNGWPIHPAPLVIGEKPIRKFLAELRTRHAEGIVFEDPL
jgi:hypothetical protein